MEGEKSKSRSVKLDMEASNMHNCLKTLLGVPSISETISILQLQIGGRILHGIFAYAHQAGRDVRDENKLDE